MTDVSIKDSWAIEDLSPLFRELRDSNITKAVFDDVTNRLAAHQWSGKAIVAMRAQLAEAQEQNRILTARCDELADALVMMREIAPDKTLSDDAFHAHHWADKALARVDALGGEHD